MAASARVYEFDVSVDRNGTATSGHGGGRIEREDAWWAEHLVLAGLVRCTLASLKHAARRAELDVAAQGQAHGTVTKRGEDGLYAFVAIESSFELEVSPAPAPDELADLLARTERGCFVGNSLTTRPRYRWKVNGEDVP
jgi:organic hydroperoxide reductase OsmC/OhrA